MGLLRFLLIRPDRTLETVDAISCMLRGMMGTMHPTIGYNDLTIDLHLASVLMCYA